MIQAYMTFEILHRLYDQYEVTIPHLTGGRREETVQKREALKPQLEAALENFRREALIPQLEFPNPELKEEYSKRITAMANDRETIANHMHSLCFVLLKFEPSMALVEELVTAVTAVFEDLS